MEFQQRSPNYHVDWPARTLSQDRTLIETKIHNVAANYLTISYPQNMPKGAMINVEFYVSVNNSTHRIRAITIVEASHISSKNILLQLRISKSTPSEIHTFNNALMELSCAPSQNKQ